MDIKKTVNKHFDAILCCRMTAYSFRGSADNLAAGNRFDLDDRVASILAAANIHIYDRYIELCCVHITFTALK